MGRVYHPKGRVSPPAAEPKISARFPCPFHPNAVTSGAWRTLSSS